MSAWEKLLFNQVYKKNAASNTDSIVIPLRKLTMENRNKIDNFDINKASYS